MQIGKSLPKPVRFRAAISTYILLLSLMGFPAWLGLLSLLVSMPGAGGMLLLGLGIMLFVALWLSRFAVELTNEAITYRTLWGGTRTLQLRDIRKAAVEMGDTGDGVRSRPMIRLALYPLDASGQERIDINMKVFAREDVQRLLEHLGLDRRDLSIARRLRTRAE